MESALVGVDVVREREDVFAVSVCVLKRHLDGVTLLFGLVIEDRRVDSVLVVVEVFNELLDSAFEAEVVLGLRTDSSVHEVDGEAFVEEGHLAESALERAIVVYCLVEDIRIRPELGLGSCLAALVLAYDCELRGALALEVLLLIDLVVAPDLHHHVRRKRVYDGRADAMQTSGYLVSSSTELAAGVQLSMDDLNCRYAHLRVDVHRHTASVVLHDYGVVRLYADAYVFTISCERFVD